MVAHPDYSLPVPDEWAQLEDEWNEKVQDALEKADDTRGRPALSRKEIDGSAYYYLQWRHGDTVETQYVAPVQP